MVNSTLKMLCLQLRQWLLVINLTLFLIFSFNQWINTWNTSRVLFSTGDLTSKNNLRKLRKQDHTLSHTASHPQNEKMQSLLNIYTRLNNDLKAGIPYLTNIYFFQNIYIYIYTSLCAKWKKKRHMHEMVIETKLTGKNQQTYFQKLYIFLSFLQKKKER